tara:strand:- start:398 stop:1651 length:1254 start_codon:yes stop_codon:yes gene_type:complete
MEITLFTPHLGQKKVINDFSNSKHKFGTVVTSRQWGKSLLGQNLLLYWLLATPNQKGCWISPIYNQARKVFSELMDASSSIIQSSNKAELTLKFINGSTVQFLSSERPDSVRGFSFNYMIVDEAAYVNERGFETAILPTLTAIGKKCLIISTPKSKNWFYKYYLRGLDGSTEYISFRGQSTDNPYIDQSFIAEQRLSLPDDIFRQEYMAEFTDAGSEVFRNVDNACVVSQYINGDKVQRCFVGIDTGLSNDYSVLCIMNETGRVLLLDRLRGENINTIASRFNNILSKFKIEGGYVEENGIGAAMRDLVIPRNRRIRGFTTTQDSKTTIVRTLISDLEAGVIELPAKELEPEVYKELSLYTYKLSNNGKLSFTHQNGMHDDFVDAIMLANKARNEVRTNKMYISPAQKQYKPRFGVM